ncbi:hypothetical protein ACQ86B_17350 [Mycolicibacterium aichiense]|uniref:hypothetical protein n=1 Tax=Mycolicibacterium aichiense TaxID=1799 RepID=UPI003D675F96
MNYTEIPTDLLQEVRDLVSWIDSDLCTADAYEWVVNIKDNRGAPVDPESYDFVVRFKTKDWERMQPLVKWLDYISAVWGRDVVDSDQEDTWAVK